MVMGAKSRCLRKNFPLKHAPVFRNLIHAAVLLAAILCAPGGKAAAVAPTVVVLDGQMEVVISVADQRMAVICDGGLVNRYPVSTSRFGTGDSLWSYRTPLGRLRICDKIGDGLPAGAVIKHRNATGEVLAVNAPGRDPIVTRILWLEGLDEQNKNAKERSIYIHGTPEENQIGKSVSWGCIRMRSSDVIALYEEVPVGTPVTIVAEHLPHYPKYVQPPPPEQLVAKNAPAPAGPARGAAGAARATPEPVAAPPHGHATLVATAKWQGEAQQTPPAGQKASTTLKQSILVPTNAPVILTSRNPRASQTEDHSKRQPTAAERERPKSPTDTVFPQEKLSLAIPREEAIDQFALILAPPDFGAAYAAAEYDPSAFVPEPLDAAVRDRAQ